MTDTSEKTPSPSQPGPLDGIVVVDLTRVLSGPYCTMLLADMGARVIKIERPGRGDDTRAWGPPFIKGESAYFLSINRNKESVTLDFKDPEGRRVLEALLDRADVLVENFRPGTLEKLGLGYAQLAERLPRLIYCSVSGFGQNGPARTRPGYDAVVQAESGLMSITGPHDGSAFRLGVAITDITAGMFAAQGVLLALLARHQTGRGQFVDIAMLDAAAALLTYQAGIFFATGQSPTRLGNRHPTIMPYETFEATDGEFVVAVGNDDLWVSFCRAIELPALAEDARFATNRQRVSIADELRPILTQQLSTQPASYWVDALSRAGVPCGLIRDIEAALTDPQLLARDMVQTLAHPTAGPIQALGVPVKLSETPGQIRTPPPTLGEHTEGVLASVVGLEGGEIARLRERGVL